MMDIRTPDGSIVKITTPSNGDQDLAKTLGVEMVQNMYKVGFINSSKTSYQIHM